MRDVSASSNSVESGAGMLRGALVVALIAMAIRAPGVTRPLLGPFATRNVVNSMAARNWGRGIAPLYEPTLDVLIGGKRSLHLVEYPVPSLLTAGAWRSFGGSFDVWMRVQAILWSGVAAGFLYALAHRWFGVNAARWGAFAFVVSPVGIVYGQNAMLEPAVVAWMVATIYAVDVWRERRGWGWLALAFISLAALWLTKIYMLVILAPIVWEARRDAERWRLAVVMLLAAAPAIAWNLWAWNVSGPGGAHAGHIYFSLRDSFATTERPMLLRFGFYIGFAKDMLLRPIGPVAFVGVLAGIFDRRARRLAPWLIAMGVLVIAMPRKFHEMDYYFLILAPPLCLLAGVGWQRIVEWFKPPRWLLASVVIAWLGMNARLSVSKAFFTPREDRAVVPAAAAARAMLGPDEPIVTMHGSGIDLLYHCDAPGWAISPDDPRLEAKLREARIAGARYFVVAEEGAGKPVLISESDNFSEAAFGEGFVIFRLTAGH